MPPPFTPYTGFLPDDGDDPRVTPGRDNPCRVGEGEVEAPEITNDEGRN